MAADGVEEPRSDEGEGEAGEKGEEFVVFQFAGSFELVFGLVGP